MTGVVRQMIDVSRNVPQAELDSLLASHKAGERLFAYASLYAAP